MLGTVIPSSRCKGDFLIAVLAFSQLRTFISYSRA